MSSRTAFFAGVLVMRRLSLILAVIYEDVVDLRFSVIHI